MLKIGKSNKYYTLWDVTSEVRYITDSHGRHLPSYNQVTYTYLQNLSLDKDKAIEKAKSKGVTELVPDEDLYGRNRSWSRREYIVPTYEPYEFRFGRYTGSDIRECDDFKYLTWYYGETSNEFAKDRVIELEPTVYTEYEGRLERIETVERLKVQAKLKEEIETSIRFNGYADVFVDRNVNDMGLINVGGVEFYFRNVRDHYYRNFLYYLPVINGKAKRIKNKNVRFHVSEKRYVDGISAWEVKCIEIIKK